MKKEILFLAVLGTFIKSQGQQTGEIVSLNNTPRSDIENRYLYIPPKNLVLPKKLRASVIYFDNMQNVYDKKKIIITRSEGKYRFSIRVPDSTEVLEISIIDYYNNIIDNNKFKGYISYLYQRNGKQFISSKITLAAILNSGFASYYHRINYPPTFLLSLFEQGFKLQPGAIYGKFYLDYLFLVYKDTPSDSIREKLIGYAERMTSTKNNEQNWINAMRVYRELKMREKQKEVEDNILLYFPHGETEKENFWSTIYLNEEISTTAFLDSIQHYKTIFGDSSKVTMDNFYLRLIYLNAKRKNFDTIFKYSGLVTDKLLLASAFNQIAWDLAGGGIDGKANNLDQASILSRSSIHFVQEKLKNNFVTDDPDELIGAHFYYTDTYALIVYKQNKIDSAFYYESELWQTGLMEAAGMETYAIYSEKAKGLKFAKHFIETQLLNGIHSPFMLKQLDSIDQRLNISHDNYIKIEKINYLVSKRKTSNEMLERFGTIKSPSFRIKNIQGQYVSLSDFRGKVIILDFWATWCGPCRESFPSMQELVKRYTGDKLVAFLFIDIWEETDGKTMQERALKLIKENNYDFNILLDEHNNVAESYKIRSIPTKVVIDKYGNIVYVGEGSGGLLEIIDDTRRH